MKTIYVNEPGYVWDKDKGAAVEKTIKRAIAQVPDAAEEDAIIRLGRIYRNVYSE